MTIQQTTENNSESWMAIESFQMIASLNEELKLKNNQRNGTEHSRQQIIIMQY